MDVRTSRTRSLKPNRKKGYRRGGMDETIDEGEDPEGNDRKKKERPSWILFSL